MTEIKKVFGLNLKKYRIKKGLSQEKLAELIGLGSKSISPIEGGYSFIAIEKMSLLCDKLGVEVYQMFIPDASEDESNTDEELKEKVFNRLKICNRSELELFCKVLSSFID